MKKLTMFSMSAILSVACFGPSTMYANNTYATAADHDTTNVNAEFTKIMHNNPEVDPKALKGALKAYSQAHARGLDNKNLLTIIDFSKPSSEKRFWVIDLNTDNVLFDELVAHGKNSGGNVATNFSNVAQSKASSLGLFETKNTYYGKHGLSLRMAGLNPGLNNNAMRRDIVIHGANYVSEGFVNRVGRLGRSWGCPALSMKVYKPVINTIKDGTLVYAYYPSTALANAKLSVNA